MKIYTKSSVLPPQYIGENANIENSLISEGTVILGKVENSVIFPGVYVAENAHVKDSVVMDNCRILSDAVVDKAIVGTKAVINGPNHIGDGKEVVLIDDNKNMKPEVK